MASRFGAVEQDPPRGRIVEARDEIRHRRLPRAAPPHERHHRPAANRSWALNLAAQGQLYEVTNSRRNKNAVLRHPAAFAIRVLKAFQANQGLLLAGAVAYYTLLSLVPLLILMFIVLSQLVDATPLFATLTEYLEFAVPGQSAALVDGLRAFLVQKETVGLVLSFAMLVSSALAFGVLQNAMSVIFFHRLAVRRRSFIVSALLPYFFIGFLATGLLVVTLVSGRLASMGTEHVTVFGMARSLGGISASLLYLLGVVGEIFLLTAIYLVMPVGRLSWRHALIGGVTATLLWEVTRHVLTWYLGTISQIRVVYGSFTTAIAVLISVELAAIVLLFGAQVIAEYERMTSG
jgi:membrane protein